MTESINTKACPFCSMDNKCDVNNEKGCWCGKVNIPVTLTDLVPVKLKKKACICDSCIALFNLDEGKFLDKLNGL